MTDPETPATAAPRRRLFGFRTPGAFDPAARIAWNVAAEAQKSQLPQMAAALAYRTIFGLLPMFIVGLVAIRAFASPERVRQTVRSIVQYIGLGNIEFNPRQYEEFIGPPLPGQGPGAIAPGKGLDDWLVELLERANERVSFDAIGWIAVAALLYAAISMMVEVERAFNQIYKVPSGRSWVRRLTQYWTLLTLGGVGLVATFYLQQQFETHAENTVRWVAEMVDVDGDAAPPPGEAGPEEPRAPEPAAGAAPVEPETPAAEIAEGISDTASQAATTIAEARADPARAPWWLSAIKFLTTAAISTGILLLAYTAVPNTKVRFWPALAGAATGAILFEGGKWGFAQYVEYSATYAKLYGSLALIPLFMLWVYVTWLIVLAGLQLAYYLQYGRENKVAQPILDTGAALVEPAAALVVMTAIAKDFESGQADQPGELAKATRLGDGVVRLVLARLAERGYLHRVGTDRSDAAEPAYALARPPHLVSVGELLAVGFELAGGVAGNPVLERMRRAQVEAAAGQTLADVAGLPEPEDCNGPGVATVRVERDEGPDDLTPIARSLQPGPARRADGSPAPEGPATL